MQCARGAPVEQCKVLRVVRVSRRLRQKFLFLHHFVRSNRAMSSVCYFASTVHEQEVVLVFSHLSDTSRIFEFPKFLEVLSGGPCQCSW